MPQNTSASPSSADSTSAPGPNAGSTSAPGPKVDYTQEVRFALVMYGGASLCIYMNGVAQEFLRMVRATAPAAERDAEGDLRSYLRDDELKGSEKVYRQLGQMLVRGEPVSKGVESGEPIRTRLMIDILSGTSAGGINAVFLAKALANDQSMNQLREMWIEEGDIAKLLNDKESDEGIDLGQQTPPKSLLNSRRMYYKLLDALYEMDNPPSRPNGQPVAQSNQAKGNAAPAGQFTSPYADEIDLFTTATDIWGQIVNIRLADGVAVERRHLNKFHFRYRSTRTSEPAQNDFDAANNPFLAFAARCTSAHQSSFEPMKLADIDEALEKHHGYKSNLTLTADNKEWREFYQTYLRQPDALNAQHDPELIKVLAGKFKNRPFSDGGALDNSPFSFAIDQLYLRHSNLPVERKLMYVEPVPEHPEETSDPTRPPDALQNAWLALSVLPRYQFIREDLERLLERNRLVERVSRIINGIERDEMHRLLKTRTKQLRARLEPAVGEPDAAESGIKDKARLSAEEFCKADISWMIERMSSAWGGYHRLRVAEATDEMVKLISRAAGFELESAESQAIRQLIRTWRLQNYDAYGRGWKGTLPDQELAAATNEDAEAEVAPFAYFSKETENCFLYRYDLNWHVRRLKFVLKKLDELSCFDDSLKVFLGISGQATTDGAATRAADNEATEVDVASLRREFAKRRVTGKQIIWRYGKDPKLLQKQSRMKDVFDEEFKALSAHFSKLEDQTTQPAARAAIAASISAELSALDEFASFLSKEFDPEEKARTEAAFRKCLQSLKARLGETLREMVIATRTLLPQSLFAVLKDINRADLLEIAEGSTDEARTQRAAALLNNKTKEDDFNEFLKLITPSFNIILYDAAVKVEGTDQESVLLITEATDTAATLAPVKGILEDDAPAAARPALTAELIARRALRYYYDSFDRYDMISYPILYATSVGEEIDVVDVYRISPEDADHLIPDKQLRRRKLAGTSLSNFGAFFDERFRINDILWGRLDCAERIITALLPMTPEYEATKDRLIREAQRAIIAEEYAGTDQAGISALLGAFMGADQSPEKQREFLQEFRKLLNSKSEVIDKLAAHDEQGIEELQKFVKLSLTGSDPLNHFVATYDFNYAFDPKTMVTFSGRASKVFGKMLEGIAEANRIDKSRVVWVTRLAQLFWGLVEVAVPGSIGNLVWHHWLKLLYLFEFLMILLGTLLLSQTVQQFGILTFALTVALHAVTLVLGDKMNDDAKWLSRIKSWGFIGLLVMLSVAALIGLFFFVSFAFFDNTWNLITKARETYARDDWRHNLLRTLPVIIASGAILIFMLRGMLQNQLRAKVKVALPPKEAARLSLAKRLRQIRYNLALSHAEMAAQLRLDAQAIKDYESCARKPPRDVLMRYARVVGISLEDLQDDAHVLTAPGATRAKVE